MQQLNVLPIKVSPNIEIKDDATAFTSPASKDDFSQYIESHLAKSKDVDDISDAKNKGFNESINTKIDKISADQKNLKTDSQTQNSAEKLQALAAENDSVKDVQEVAAAGRKDETESNKVKTDGADQTVDESELLMSFLTKADNTLIDKNSVGIGSVEGIKLGTMYEEQKASEEQKVKNEAYLLLKSSDLVADLSGVAKAIISRSETESEDISEQEKQEKALNLTIASAKNTKTNTDINQLIAEPLIDSNGLTEKNVVADKPVNEKSEKSTQDNSFSQQLNSANVDEKGSDESTSENQKSVELVQNDRPQPSVIRDIDPKISNQIVVDSEKAVNQQSQKELSQQAVMSASNNIDSSNVQLSEKSPISPKSIISSQAITNTQPSLEAELKVNEQIAKLIQNEKGITKLDANLTSAISVAQSFAVQDMNKNLSTANLSAASLGQAVAESLVKESSLAESTAQLNAKSVENLVEQSKGLGAVENKEVSAKVLSKTTADFSINGSFIDSTGRATQADYDRVDQQSAEIFNLTGSADVSQTQKTNPQLHNETIAIFRKDFADAVKDKVMLMISQKLQQFDITLDPPELGNMQVRVNLQGEQATVNFVVQNQQAKEALEQNMQKLRDSLAEQGVDVGEANVEQQSEQSCNDENKEDNVGDSYLNSTTNTADASDVIEHSLSASMVNSSTTAVDYYA
tara:strand:+ start:17560 stop:19629 length:2070 start_codon:yes stop_codon:yes gene_type:complete